MSNENFKQAEDTREDEITLDELKLLMERLHVAEPEPAEEDEDHAATVEAVCEVTGETQERVWQVLRQIREEDLQTRLAERLREAEEPLYRVERPGFECDPLAALSFMKRSSEFDSALDGLGKGKKSKKKAEPTTHDRVSELMAILILLLVVVAILFMFILGLRQERG